MTHVIVTGASSGIGRALVREFVGTGAAVTAVARRGALLQELVDELGAAVHPVIADLSDPAQASSWLPAAVAARGPVDVLVNNAGVQIVARTVEIPIAEMRAMFEVDLLTPLSLIQAVLPEMIARDRGAIVNLASVAALAPTPGMTHYSGAKAGLAAASEVLRGELRHTGITVVTVYPGPVDTPMARAAYDIVPPTAAVKLLPEGVPAVLAHRIRRAIERRRARIIYPAIYTLVRHTPALTRAAMDRFTPLPPPRKSAG